VYQGVLQDCGLKNSKNTVWLNVLQDCGLKKINLQGWRVWRRVEARGSSEVRVLRWFGRSAASDSEPVFSFCMRLSMAARGGQKRRGR
jgi:hypothetical protein